MKNPVSGGVKPGRGGILMSLKYLLFKATLIIFSNYRDFIHAADKILKIVGSGFHARPFL